MTHANAQPISPASLDAARRVMAANRVSRAVMETARDVRDAARDAGDALVLGCSARVIDAYWRRWPAFSADLQVVLAFADDGGGPAA